MPSYEDYKNKESSRLGRAEGEGYGSTTNNMKDKKDSSLLTEATTGNGDDESNEAHWETTRLSNLNTIENSGKENEKVPLTRRQVFDQHLEALTKIPLRRVALDVSLYVNLFITLVKFVAYIQTMSLSVLAALLDSVLDVVSQFVLNYTEKHSSLQRSSAFYPAGASRLEPIGVLTCAALMGMGSFEVLKESAETLITMDNPFNHADGGDGLNMSSFWSMAAIVIVKLLLLLLCQRAAETNSNIKYNGNNSTSSGLVVLSGGEGNSDGDEDEESELQSRLMGESTLAGSSRAVMQMADPTLEALAQDHWNDAVSNTVAAAALLAALQAPRFWFLDPVGAILISLYIIWSWFETGREQIEQLTGKSAPDDFIEELLEIANNFDERMLVDVCRAYHFGPKFLVELEVVLPKNTLLFESHDLGMELQYEIESREEVERCFVHIDYEQRPYDEHVVSKVPHLREKYRPGKDGLRWRSARSL